MAPYVRSLFAIAALALAAQAGAQTKLSLGYTGANAFMAAFIAKPIFDSLDISLVGS